MDTNLSIRIETSGGALTLTPESLLNFYLPGAKPMSGQPDIWEGQTVTETGVRTVYLHRATLAGALMEAREKHLNPITDLYIMPANAPTKKSSHKIKYTAQLDRLRGIPGFLGLHSGLMVLRDKQLVETRGAFYLPTDTVLGAWAEADFTGMHRPVRHEVMESEVRGPGPLWKTRLAQMLLKSVEDQLCYMKLMPRYAGAPPLATENEEEIILESVPAPESPSRPQEQPLSDPAPPFEFQPDTIYHGPIKTLAYRKKPTGKGQYGILELATKHGDLKCLFFSRPELLKGIAEDEWPTLLNSDIYAVSFTLPKEGDYKVVKTFDILLSENESETQEIEEENAA